MSGTSTPGPVTALIAGTPGQTSVPLTWQPASTGPAATAYEVDVSPAGQNAWTAFATGLTAASATVTGLSAATSYDFRVIPSNSAGAGATPTVVAGITTAAVPATTPTTDAAYVAPALLESQHRAEFLVMEANGYRSRDVAVVSNGGAAMVTYPAGLVVAVSGTPGAYTAAPYTAATAAGTPAAILYSNRFLQPGQAQKSTIVDRDAEVNLLELRYDASISTPALQATLLQALAAKNVICR